MLAFRTQVMMIAIMIAAIICIINMLRKKKLDFKFGLGWLFVAVCILVLAAFPVLLDKIAYLAGIASPVNMLFFLGFALTVVLIFALSIAVSRLSDRVKKLSQEIAIIRRDMYDRVTELEMK
ncbi:MAG: DUF2304 domain-containing protein [Lachnospiraceae bacterium]|nr:DUF2304 domain-containing protein [Lachnospiraceae bacterium]RKI27245.1 DUF2304 domain-containing protein [bacterium D16-36]RKI66440.1 DUF2304 domain-containing protein [bacterium 1xD8-6]